MFYVLAEEPPTRFLVFPAQELLELFQSQFMGTCQAQLGEFKGGFPPGKKFQYWPQWAWKRRESLLTANCGPSLLTSIGTIRTCRNNGWSISTREIRGKAGNFFETSLPPLERRIFKS